jgi:hypothetical protein
MAITNNPDTLDEIVREWARTKIQRVDILNHNGAMLAYTDKANVANKLGLTEKQKLGVTPFPSSYTIMAGVEPSAQVQTEPKMTQTQKLINTVILLMAAGGLTLGTMSYLDKSIDTQGQVGLEVEGWQTK